MLSNFKKWFNFNCEVIYFYNVYGDRQIKTEKMATIIGIFEQCYIKKHHYQWLDLNSNKKIYTHKRYCANMLFSLEKNKSRHYSISHKKIIQSTSRQNV